MTEQSGWQLSGSAPEAYEHYLAASILSPCTPGLIEAAAVTSGERVLDVACGTGTVARCAAHQVGTTGRVNRVVQPPPSYGSLRAAQAAVFRSARPRSALEPSIARAMAELLRPSAWRMRSLLRAPP